jgi:hypothetical protein
MPRTQPASGIVNGHWERAEPRSAWLLMLARMGAAELRMLSDWARTKSDDAKSEDSPPATEFGANHGTAH